MLISQNRTKIVATIGPATKDEKTQRALIEAGLDVARFNFSHGKYEEFEQWLYTLRRIANEDHQSLAILQDLQGPRIRLGGDLPKKGVTLAEGERIAVGFGKYKKGFLPIDYKKLAEEVKIGTKILMMDGMVELKVVKKARAVAYAQVVRGGLVLPRKGINIPNAHLSIGALTTKDLADLRWGVEHDVDFIGLSFVQSAEDIKKLRQEIFKIKKDSRVKIIAKIEKPHAYQSIKSILREADGVMVARGDLGIELPPERVPLAQKEIIATAVSSGKPVITATQMMESMMSNPRPTRAEVSDVANAVLDGTDAVMLSEETAMGPYPVKAVKMMASIIRETEKGLFRTGRLSFDNFSLTNLVPLKKESRRVISPKIIGPSAKALAKNVRAKCIVCFTETGFSARMISQARPQCFVVALSHDKKVINQLALSWGVVAGYGILLENEKKLMTEIAHFVKAKELAKKDDLIVIVANDHRSYGAKAVHLG